MMHLEDHSGRGLIVSEPDDVGAMLAELFAAPDEKREATVVKGAPEFLEYAADAERKKT